MHDEKKEPPVTRKEAARLIGVSQVTIDRLLASRRLACYRIGRRILIGSKHIEDFLIASQQKAR